MKTFILKISTPDGMLFNGEAQRVICRGIAGDLAILAGHCKFCTALGRGRACVTLADGKKREGTCAGGLLSVMDGTCRILAPAWEWKEEIKEEETL